MRRNAVPPSSLELISRHVVTVRYELAHLLTYDVRFSPRESNRRPKLSKGERTCSCELSLLREGNNYVNLAKIWETGRKSLLAFCVLRFDSHRQNSTLEIVKILTTTKSEVKYIHNMNTDKH